MIIRPIQEKDLVPTRLLITAAIEAADIRDHAALPEQIDACNESALAQLNEPDANHAITLVCQMADEVIGTAQFNQDGEVKLFYVQPEWQRRGIGRALLAEMALNAQCLDITTLQVHSTLGAKLFFIEHGFRSQDSDFSEWLVADLTKWKIKYEATTTH
ncbi:GNAT family N-acetyltransferase [Chitinibacter bivalviorum]|uniref:GNAT family N-acetyltransferase n=1 Tax=Chitinibacter bivalviorum TaxID=2739434 RepID=A0A7H9BGI4_9NEIS|nr:GNAT family N-acetyltransferase [Chitinibacter bivalviorum]QLG87532.1 GNAT family N-acetyltransferase [Chitinibacter bivalviorum]